MNLKRIVKIAGLSVLLLLIGRMGYVSAKQLTFQPTIPAPAYDVPQSRTEAWQQDLDYFGHYLRLNRPYTEETRATAEKIIEQLVQNIETLSDNELKLGVVEAIALSQNGHSDVWIPDLSLIHI